MAVTSNTPVSILRRKQVEARTGLARSTLYAFIATGSFPTPISLGARAVGWLESDIDDWVKSRIQITQDTSSKNITQRAMASAFPAKVVESHE